MCSIECLGSEPTPIAGIKGGINSHEDYYYKER